MMPPAEAIESSRTAAGLQFLLKDKQIETISSVLSGHDTVAILPTGYGKSLTYTLLPAAWDNLNGHSLGTSIVIVISPLVALMEEQLKKMDTLGISAVHLGSVDNTTEMINKAKKGEFPLVLMSPEGLFSGQWRDILEAPVYRSRVRTITVDEAHSCVIWGNKFRTDYARIGELRSIFPDANMLALTASAPPAMRLKIAELLALRPSKTTVVEVSVDRPNIMFTAVRAPLSVPDTLYWIADELRTYQQECPKYIIYCRSVKDVAKIWRFLYEELESDGYIGHVESVSTRLFAMFHRSTKRRVKKFVMNTFPKQNSSIRVVIATIAFGMGIDVPDVKGVVHWGAARTFEGFFQECGRAGRDSEMVPQAFSLVYHQAANVSSVACDAVMREYCVGPSDVQKERECRRQAILKHFSGKGRQAASTSHQHNCCDICHSKCQCRDCPPLPGKPPLETSDNELVRCARDAEQDDVREVTPALKSQLKIELLNLRETFEVEYSLISGELLSGLDDEQIKAIVDSVGHIHSVEDLMTEYLYDMSVAIQVMQLIKDIFDTFITDEL